MLTQHVAIEPFTTRARLRELAEQLACEYAGAAAPGHIMRLVAATAARLRRTGVRGDVLLHLTKDAVRTALAGQLGTTLAAAAG